MGKRKRTRIPDRLKMGKSSVVPFLESESWHERHARRKNEALNHKGEVETWCNNHYWSLRINNNGHHWIFITKEKKMIEWFPSSGKLAFGKNWRSTVHCHDYLQLITALEYTL